LILPAINWDVAVVLAAPGATPVFELEKLLRGFFYEGFDGVLIAEPIAAGDGVAGASDGFHELFPTAV
jgi:hypothetical protein